MYFNGSITWIQITAADFQVILNELGVTQLKREVGIEDEIDILKDFNEKRVFCLSFVKCKQNEL